METKQTRKEPLTTIGVNQSTIAILDEYLKDKNLSRKEFVEKAVNYFVRTGFDLNDNISQLTPIQNAVEDLKELHESTKTQNDALFTLLNKIHEVQNQYVQKALPAQESAQNAELYKERYFKIKNILIEISNNKTVVRIGKINRIIKEYLDL